MHRHRDRLRGPSGGCFSEGRDFSWPKSGTSHGHQLGLPVAKTGDFLVAIHIFLRIQIFFATGLKGKVSTGRGPVAAVATSLWGTQKAAGERGSSAAAVRAAPSVGSSPRRCVLGRRAPQDSLIGLVSGARLSRLAGPAARRPCPGPSAGRGGPIARESPRGSARDAWDLPLSAAHPRSLPVTTRSLASRGVRSCPFVPACVRLVAPRALSRSSPDTRMRPLLYALQPRVPHGEHVS